MNVSYSVKNFLLLTIFFIVQSLLLTAHGQQHTARGRIVNENGDPVPAVISIKGSANKVGAGPDGVFEIKFLSPGDTLIVSGVSIEQQEISIRGRSRLGDIMVYGKVKMEDEVKLASTGYQSIKPNEVNGSVVVIDNKTLNQQVGAGILQRLEGVTSSLLVNTGKSNGNPQNSTNISIRGLSTIQGPLDPLIVLDGFIYEGNIANINPNDIESVTVLKDASAASIWGARAGNGVIVLTTKKARYNQPLQLSLNAVVSIGQKPDLFYLPQMSSADYIAVEQMLFSKGYFNSAINSKYRSLTPAVEVFLAKANGLISAADSADRINRLMATDTRDQFDQYVYRRSLQQQYALTLQGGSPAHSYLFGLAYDKAVSDLRASSRKLNLRLENNFRLLKNMQLAVAVYYTNTQNTSGQLGYNNTVMTFRGRQVPYFSLADDAGSPLSIPLTYRDAFIDTLGAGHLLNWKYYPLNEYKQAKTSIRSQELFTRFGITYRLLKFLSLNLSYQYQRQQTNSERNAGLESYEARNIINSFSQLDYTTGNVTYIVPVGAVHTLGNAVVSSQTARAQANVQHSSGFHNFSAIAGAEVREAKGFSNSYTVYGYNNDPLAYSSVDWVNSYRHFITGNYDRLPNSPSFSNTVYRFVSFYANGAYTYRRLYSISASARRDGSNIFGASTNDRWKPLWSIGAGWQISGENFYNLSLLPLLKLRLAYGYSGNVDLSRSANPVAGFATGALFTNLPYARITGLNNPSLRWEKTGQLNIGLDFMLMNNRVSGSVDWYRKKGTDLYGEAVYDYTSFGARQEIRKNVAAMKGTGIDVILNARLVDAAFKWNTTVLFNYNHSETTKYLKSSAQRIASFLSGGSTISPVIGKPLYAIAAYKWGGLNNTGNPQGFLDGQLSTDYNAIASVSSVKGLESGSIVYIGPANPRYFGSFIHSFSYKAFTASFNIGYKFAYYFRSPALRYNALFDNGIGHAEFADRWKKPGDEAITHVPSLIYPSSFSRDDFYSQAEIHVHRADHIRLQYINLAYSFEEFRSWLQQFKNLQVYVNLANLGILWKANKLGLDPDFPAVLKPAPVFSFGLRTDF